jgi:NAD(P)-dependent dehydrogenase (short-subunit alcohol dehydrogenase family)
MSAALAAYPSLAGRVVFITGGAMGIGAALVRAFHDQGARVAFIDLAAAEGEALAATLPGAWFRPVDVTDTAALEAAIAGAAADLGTITVLVNNVANDTRHRPEDTDAEAWRARLAVNLDPTFLAARAVRNGMAGAGGGSIINFSSITAYLGPADLPAYVASKGAVIALTKSLARAWGGEAIRVNAIAPGWVETERQRALWLNPAAEAAWTRESALHRLIQPEEVAQLALFLAADDSAAITGQTILIDAGRV